MFLRKAPGCSVAVKPVASGQRLPESAVHRRGTMDSSAHHCRRQQWPCPALPRGSPASCLGCSNDRKSAVTRARLLGLSTHMWRVDTILGSTRVERFRHHRNCHWTHERATTEVRVEQTASLWCWCSVPPVLQGGPDMGSLKRDFRI